MIDVTNLGDIDIIQGWKWDETDESDENYFDGNETEKVGVDDNKDAITTTVESPDFNNGSHALALSLPILVLLFLYV